MEKICQNCKNVFILNEDLILFCGKMQVPTPTFCPSCRFFRRSMWRNEHFLFRKKDENTGELIFSGYPPDSIAKVYEHSYWWSDKWDPKSYGIDYDFNTPFFPQFYELLGSVPLCARAMKNSVNSEYCNNVTNVKNCYLSFNAKNSENICYGFHFSGSNDCFDVYETKDSRLCYETFSVVDSERVFWSSNCAECYNVWFSDNCRNCTDCFGCVNLRSKKYCIFNEQYTKDEYLIKVNELYSGSFKDKNKVLEKISEFQKGFPAQYMHGNRNKNVTGDYIYASNNVVDSFEIHNVDNAQYCQFVRKSKDVCDFTSWGGSCELIYDSISCGESSQNLRFCFECWPSCHDLDYCVECHSSSYCFGCVGLQKGQYCIFNKQYSKEEYFLLRNKIINQMNNLPYKSVEGCIYTYGEFFPPEFSPFKYEESAASDYFRTEVYKKIPNQNKIEISSVDLPESVESVDESIVSKVISCQHEQNCTHRCVGAFKITEMELQFYKRFNVPLPRECPNCRFYVRMSKLNPVSYRVGTCSCVNKEHNHENQCKNVFKTNYSIYNSKILYCEDCYKQDVS